MKERDKTVDCLKGYACLLVVFGHVIMGVRKSGNINVPLFSEPMEAFIWTFHVALFMFLSGYVYKITGGWQSKGGRMKFVLHKLLNLGVPYLAFSTVYIAINSMVPGVNNQNELSDILWLWRSPTAQYWFLYALLGLFVLYTVLSGAMNNWQITLTLVLSFYFAPVFGVEFGSFGASISLALAFGLGTIVPSLIFDKQKTWVRIGIIIGHLLVVGFLIYMGWSNLLIVKHFAQVAGIIASIALISLVMQIGLIKKFLLFINKYSFPIYLLHTIFTAGIRIVLNKVGITNYWIHITVGTLFGVMFPFVGAWIMNKIPAVDFFLYPSKNIKRLKSK